MFKKALIPALALVAASVAVPAAAQSYGRDHRGNNDRYEQNNWQNINQRQAQLDRRIDQGVRNGSLSRREAVALRTDFRNLARLEATYRRNGLSRWERADLDQRFDRLEARVRYERHDRDGRGRGR